jgi:hypothetical protein
MGIAHWVLNQAQEVLRWEHDDVNAERQHLLLWASMLKGWTASEQMRAHVWQRNLDMREELLERQ